MTRLHFLRLACALTIAAIGLLAGCAPPAFQEARLFGEDSGASLDSVVDNLAAMPLGRSRDRVVAVEQIVERMRAGEDVRLAPGFLALLIERVPGDPYIAYYCYLAGQSYRQYGQDALARIWFRKALRTNADIIAQGESVHLRSLNALIESGLPPPERIDCYRQLLERFPEKVDQGSSYYHLAQAYEEAGRYDLAFAAYARFNDFPETTIPGKLDEHQRVRELLAFADSARDWTRPDLNQLISEIRTALASKDYVKILSLQAKVNFFSMSWLQEKADFNSQVAYDLRRFILGADHIYSESTLEGNSNSQEAFLKTWGWSPYMPIWYLYFRKVNFSADPEINGNWEWVGIYFGNSIQ